MPAKSKKSSSRRSLKPTYGTLDVREPNDIPAFENMLKQGPITFVLVYADWCGHCKEYKANTWKNLESVPNKANNLASVHFDQLDKTSLKNAKIDGYPSLLVVGTDGEPATFNKDGEKTNAMPELRNENLLKSLLTRSANANTGAPSMNTNLSNSLLMTKPSLTRNSTNSTLNMALNANQGEPLNLINSLAAEPPNPAEDLVMSQPAASNSGSQVMTGGSLLDSLMQVSQDPRVLTAAALGLGATVLARRKSAKRRANKKRTRRTGHRA
jgi:thiol-disulfide isomerase/thioredoxin